MRYEVSNPEIFDSLKPGTYGTRIVDADFDCITVKVTPNEKPEDCLIKLIKD